MRIRQHPIQNLEEQDFGDCLSLIRMTCWLHLCILPDERVSHGPLGNGIGGRHGYPTRSIGAAWSKHAALRLQTGSPRKALCTCQTRVGLAQHIPCLRKATFMQGASKSAPLAVSYRQLAPILSAMKEKLDAYPGAPQWHVRLAW